MKKSESITIKTTEETKKALEELATAKEWSLSQLCDKILKEYTKKALTRNKAGSRRRASSRGACL